MNSAPYEFHKETPAPIRELLTRLNTTRERVRIFYGQPETGRAWMEENDVTGTIGKSTGPRPAPLMIHSARSMGGPALLDHCIVKIMSTKTGRTLYEHPAFSNPADDIALFVIEHPDGHICEARQGEEVHARFKSWAPARNWLAFMRGTRFSK